MVEASKTMVNGEVEELVSRFKDCSAKLRDNLIQLHRLQGASGSLPEGKLLKLKSGVLFTEMKKFRRDINIRVKLIKDDTDNHRKNVDSLHLNLDNLLYERGHIRKEIMECKEFRSKHEEIDLVSLKEFYKNAPQKLTGSSDNPTAAEENSHKLTLNRLAWELQERKRLNEESKQLKELVEKEMGEVNANKQYLEGLLSHVDNLVQASLPIQQHIPLPVSDQLQFNASAKYLPKPLYMIYAQAAAFKDAFDAEHIEMKINGDFEIAKLLHKANINGRGKEKIEASGLTPASRKARKRHGSGTEKVADDGEMAEEEAEANQKSKKTKVDNTEEVGEEKAMAIDEQGESQNKVALNFENLDEDVKELLASHPLSVEVNIECCNGVVCTLEFTYLTSLKLITVRTLCSTVGGDYSSFLDKDIFSSVICSDKASSKSSSLLAYLYPDDSGDDTPNPSNYYQLNEVGISDFGEVVPLVGRPFKWAQWLGGLEYLSISASNEDTSTALGGSDFQTLSRHCMSQTLKFVKRRIESRLSLEYQIWNLQQNKKLSLPDIPIVHKLFPLKPFCTMREFKEVNVDDAIERTFRGIGSSGRKFLVEFERDGFVLRSYASMKPDYPKYPASFQVSFLSTTEGGPKGTKARKEFSDCKYLANDTFGIEEEVNVYWEELVLEVDNGAKVDSRDARDNSKKKEALGDDEKTLLSLAKCDGLLFTMQLRRLQLCFDILFETLKREGKGDISENSFGEGKLSTRLSRGKNRARPFRFDSELELFHFRD
eukprot:Nk52_evm67s914 gene=Nk52_evmTU67s914